MGSSGHGSVSHVFGERFKMMTGINLVHVSYRGGCLPDLLSGQVQVVFGTISTSIQYIRGGMLRALAVEECLWRGLCYRPTHSRPGYYKSLVVDGIAVPGALVLLAQFGAPPGRLLIAPSGVRCCAERSAT
jgi:hypothetical protein